MHNREDKILLINENIQLINEYIEEFSEERLDKLFVKLKDILFFYGITESEVRQIISNGAVKPSTRTGLSELYEITNAILFQLKYKMNSKSIYTADTDTPK